MEPKSSTSRIQTDERPPSYDATTDEDSGKEILKTIKTTLSTQARSPLGEPSPIEVQRLRNFLLYTLLVDYQVGLQRKVTLSQADANHFLQLRDSMEFYVQAADEVCPTEQERQALGPYFWSHLHNPCRTLRVPSDAVLVALDRWATYRDADGRYKSCLGPVRHSEGLRHLAIKLFIDKNVMIRRISSTLDEAEILVRALNARQGDYFESLNFETVVELRPGEGLNGWCHAHFESYTLNKKGTEYHQQQQKGTKRAQQEQAPGIKHESLLQRAKASLIAMKQRVTHERLNQLMERPRITPAPPAPQHITKDDRVTAGSVVNPDFWRDCSDVKHTGSTL